MDRGDAWDDLTKDKLETIFGLEKFDPNQIQLSWQDKKKLFEPYIQKIKSLNIKIVTVAGTNGKGETSRLLHSHLKKHNKNIALWTSPHILSVRERFIYNEELIDKEVFDELLEQLDFNNLSYYEGLFLIFCEWICGKKDLDFLILEVGLGGRLDTTNFFDADLVCLTSISRDHCEILGDNLSDILMEKLGVCRSNVPLISGVTSSHLNKIIADYTEKNAISWLNLSGEYSHFASKAYWEQNMITSLVAHEVLMHGVSNFNYPKEDQIPAPQISPGRFEQMTLKNRRFIFIGAHNLDGLRQLVQSIFLRLEKSEGLKTLFAVSLRPDQEVLSMLDLLQSCKLIKEGLSLCAFEHPKAIDVEKLFSLLKEREKKGKGNIRFARDWSADINKESSNTTLVIGSYYFIGEVQKYLLHQ